MDANKKIPGVPDMSAWKLVDLQQKARELGLSKKGTKEALRYRIEKGLEQKTSVRKAPTAGAKTPTAGNTPRRRFKLSAAPASSPAKELTFCTAPLKVLLYSFIAVAQTLARACLLPARHPVESLLVFVLLLGTIAVCLKANIVQSFILHNYLHVQWILSTTWAGFAAAILPPGFFHNFHSKILPRLVRVVQTSFLLNTVNFSFVGPKAFTATQIEQKHLSLLLIWAKTFTVALLASAGSLLAVALLATISFQTRRTSPSETQFISTHASLFRGVSLAVNMFKNIFLVLPSSLMLFDTMLYRLEGHSVPQTIIPAVVLRGVLAPALEAATAVIANIPKEMMIRVQTRPSIQAAFCTMHKLCRRLCQQPTNAFECLVIPAVDTVSLGLCIALGVQEVALRMERVANRISKKMQAKKERQ